MNLGCTCVKKWVGGLVLLLAMVGLTSVAIHWSMERCEKKLSQPGGNVSDLLSDPRLNLSSEQKKKIKFLEALYQAKVRVYCKRHCDAKAKVGTLLAGGQPSAEELQRLGQEMGEAYTESEQATLRHVMEICKVLTPEQKKLFLQKMAVPLGAPCAAKNMP